MSEENHKKYIDFVNEVFDRLKDRHGITSDPKLAEYVGEPKGNISQYRSGKRLINDWTLLQISKDAGFTYAQALEMVIFKKSTKEDAKESIRSVIEFLSKKDKSDS